MKHRINYEDKQHKDERSFEKIFTAYKNRSITKINGVFLTHTLHPLFTGGDKSGSLEAASILLKLLDFINDSERLISEHIKFTYQYIEIL